MHVIMHCEGALAYCYASWFYGQSSGTVIQCCCCCTALHSSYFANAAAHSADFLLSICCNNTVLQALQSKCWGCPFLRAHGECYPSTVCTLTIKLVLHHYRCLMLRELPCSSTASLPESSLHIAVYVLLSTQTLLQCSVAHALLQSCRTLTLLHCILCYVYCAYVKAGGGTKYLSEVVAGDQVLVVGAHNAEQQQQQQQQQSTQQQQQQQQPLQQTHSVRAIAVGRCKIEPRPMLMVSFQLDTAATDSTDSTDTAATATAGATGQLFLQQAETVRLVRPNSAFTSITTDDKHGGAAAVSETALQPGDKVLVRSVSRGTHVGRAIAAVVTEK
jgi:3-dehydroquinate synthase II